MSRERAYSTASSGYGSEDYHQYHPPSHSHHANNNNNNNTPRRKKNHNNNNNSGHHHHHHRYHDMTLLCHRVDLFDDFVPSTSKKKSSGDCHLEGLVPIRCLSADRGCACHTPCTFCHTVVEDYDEDPVVSTLPSALAGGGGAPADINPNLAFLFAGNSNAATTAKKPPASEEKDKEPQTTISSRLVIDQIFAQNHGLLSENVEGGVKLKKYHHPPVGRYRFIPPMTELPKFFEENGTTYYNTQHNGHAAETNNGDKSEEKPPVQAETKTTEENNDNDDCGGLDSFFDDFAVAPKREAKPPKPKPPPPTHNDIDHDILVFRAPLKTVVKKTITSNSSDWTGKCLCQCRYENLMKGSTQVNPHDPSVVHDKYWAQRRRLFKKFDEGIQLDAEGWYSVTPEVVADHVASRFADASEQLVRCATNNNQRDPRVATASRDNNNLRPNPHHKTPPTKAMVILDAFCGCGGNAIAFAKLPSSVVSLIVCVDVDRAKLRMAAHNASIYRIAPDRILFVEANSVAVMERCYRDGELIMDPPPRTVEGLKAYPQREMCDDFMIGGIDLLAEYARHIDAVFMDPPWGGMDYGAMGKGGYDLARDMKIRGCERGCVGFPPTPEVDGVRLLKIAAAATSTRFVAYDLPRNANKRSLASAALEAGYGGNSKLEEHYLNGRLKTVTGYFGQDFHHLLDLKKYHKGADGGQPY